MRAIDKDPMTYDEFKETYYNSNAKKLADRISNIEYSSLKPKDQNKLKRILAEQLLESIKD